MRFTLPSSVLSPVLASMAQVAGKANAVLPALSGVLMMVKADAVRFTAYNMARGIEMTVSRQDGSPFEPGATVVGAGVLYELVHAIPGEVGVEVEDGGSVALVSYPGGKAKLAAVAESEFPRPSFSKTSFEIPAETLKKGFDRVAYAADRRDPIKITNGVQVTVSGGKIRFLASDGSQVASHVADVEGPGEASVVIPVESMALMARLCDSAQVRLGWDEHGITALGGTTRLYSRVPDGKFPGIDSQLPTTYAVKASVQAVDLQAAITRVGLTADEYVSVSFGKDGLTLSSQGNLGAARESVPADVQGEGIIHFNPALVAAAISHLPGSRVLFEMEADDRPARLTTDENGYAVVMPITPAAVKAALEPDNGANEEMAS